MPEELNRHLAAVMFTDMAGYTALMQKDEAAALRSRGRHRRALEASVADRDGDVLQYFGDGSLSIFRSSVQAVEAAIAIQLGLGGDPMLRIGIHVGDIAYDAQGAYGDAINIAARLESICVPGGVTISHTVHDDIRRHPHLPAVPSGTVRLKNIQDPLPTFALALDGIAIPVVPEVDAETLDSDERGLPAAVVGRLVQLAQRPPYPRYPAGTAPGRVPLVGRHAEVEKLRALLDDAEAGHGASAFFRGARGVGKTRLSQEAAEYAHGRGWTVLTGRADASERLVPYAPFYDALMPVLSGLDLTTLARLTPGDDAALCSLFPALGRAPPSISRDEGSGIPGEAQTRLYWQFAATLAAIASHRPLLLILEDVDFADRSSLDLFRFLARQLRRDPIVLIVEYTGANPEVRQILVEVQQGLSSIGSGVVFDLLPLNEDESATFIAEALDLSRDDLADLTLVVRNWSRGNPFFMSATLRGLVEGGALRREDGRWKQVAGSPIELPHSVRDTVRVWMGQLSEDAVLLGRSMALLGRQLSYEVIRHVSGMDDAALSQVLDELVRNQVLLEVDARWTLMYSFRHPLIRETLRAEIPLATRRMFHARIAASLEAYYGDSADEHADELAYHFGHAHPGMAGPKAIRFLLVAGEAALKRQADREATDYFQEALDRMEAAPPGEALERIRELAPPERIVANLARGRRRLGEISTSLALWHRLLAIAYHQSDAESIAKTQRELGLTHMAGGALDEAIEAFAGASEWATNAGNVPLVIRSRLAQGLCYQAIGASEEAAAVVESSLELAEELGDPAVLGRVHSAALRLNIWTGHLDVVRSHAEQALALSRQSGDRGVEFWSHWAMGAMEGLIGNITQLEYRISEARRLANDIGSPFLHLETDELEIELAYARGDWAHGIALGHRSIELARATEQRLVLPRLLVWVSLMHLGRGDLKIADALITEAWQVSGADRDRSQANFVDLHAVVPAHIGRAAYHLTIGDWDEAVRVAEAGLAIADESGYVVWAVHHLLPIIGEASIHSRDLERAERTGKRMRLEAERMGHRMALAWADACEAILTWLHQDAAAGATSLRRGAEALESIPLAYEAARLRRQLAGRLAEIGDIDGSVAELRRAWVVFERMGAAGELERIRVQFREVGVEAPELPEGT